MSDEFLGEIIRKSLGRKLNTLANVGALVAAPFTGGGSLALNAARTGGTALARGAQKKLMGRRLGRAKANVESAAKDIKNVKVTPPKASSGRRPNSAVGTPSFEQGERALGPGQKPLSDFSDIGVEKPDSPRLTADTTQQPLDVGVEAPDKNQTGLASDFQGLKEAEQNQAQLQQKVEQIEQNIEQADLDNSITQQGTAAGLSSAGAVAGADMQQRAEKDRQRRDADYERAREAASTGGAKSTTG